MSVIEKIKACAVIPVIKIQSAENAVPLALALSEGGIYCAEVTFRTSAAAQAITEMKKAVPEIVFV